MQILDLNFMEVGPMDISGAGTASARGNLIITAQGTQAVGQGVVESQVLKTDQFILAWNRTYGMASSKDGAVSVQSSSTSIVRS